MDDQTVTALVEKLCRHLCRNLSPAGSDDATHFSVIYKMLVLQPTAAGSSMAEATVIENMKKILSKAGKIQDAVKIDYLCDKLKQSPVLKNRGSVLELLYQLGLSGGRRERPVSFVKTGASIPSVAPANYNASNDDTSSGASSLTPTGLSPTKKQMGLFGHSDISRQLLLKEILYSFQGVESQLFRWDATSETFCISPKVNLREPARNVVCYLLEMGWLYRHIQQLCFLPPGDSSCGLAARSFSAAVHEQLSEYYRLIAVLESQSDTLTFLQLTVWTEAPRERLKLLATLVEACHGLKGGALASTLYSFMHRGNSTMRGIVRHILTEVCKPLLAMLLLWVFSGTLRDPYGEFFIGINSDVDGSNLWNHKYYERSGMVPSFFSKEQIHQVATAGKSICFLREICLEKAGIPGLDNLRRTTEQKSHSLLDLDWGSIEEAYNCSSHHLLRVLLDRYHVQVHLHALKQYLLLGQGDFVSCLLKLLEPELDKPINNRMNHVLASILDKCIRSTNSQYDDQDVLRRLDVRTSDLSLGCSGWDVFSIDYKVEGPLATIITAEVKARYEILFHSLWRSRRMDRMMCKLRHQQLTESRMLRSLTAIEGLLHHAQLLLTEMKHFAREMMHYINFEVIECGWQQLVASLAKVRTMDQLLSAHNDFLTNVTARVLLDEDSKDYRDQLRAIYESMRQFSQIQETLYTTAMSEYERRQHQPNESFSKSLLTEQFISQMQTKLSVTGIAFQNFVLTFLLSLSSHNDPNLQGLSSRLDFNEFYQRKDSRLSMSLTYSRRRQTLAPFSK